MNSAPSEISLQREYSSCSINDSGKYVPTLSYRLATDEGFAFVPLQGMIIGNGFSDPLHMLEYGDFLEGVGLLNREQADEISQQTKVQLIWSKIVTIPRKVPSW